MGKQRHFSEESKREAACLVLDRDYSVNDAYEAMGVEPTTMQCWVANLKKERTSWHHT